MVVVDVELLDLYRGSEFNVTFTRQEICDHCNGTGAEHKVAPGAACGLSPAGLEPGAGLGPGSEAGIEFFAL